MNRVLVEIKKVNNGFLVSTMAESTYIGYYADKGMPVNLADFAKDEREVEVVVLEKLNLSFQSPTNSTSKRYRVTLEEIEEFK